MGAAVAQIQCCSVFYSLANQKTPCIYLYLFSEATTAEELFPSMLLTLLDSESWDLPTTRGRWGFPEQFWSSAAFKVLGKGIILTYPPNRLPTHASNWQLNLKEFICRKLLKWRSFLWFIHWYKNSWLKKNKTNNKKTHCGNLLNKFFLLLSKLGKSPNEGGWLCWIIKA